MHPTQHSTIRRRASAPVVSHTIGIECTHEDILATIAQIAAQQSTCFVMIATVAVSLGLTDDDRPWLLTALHELDLQGRICLNALEKPQNLVMCQLHWFVRNTSGVPCHEVCIAPDSHRLKPLLQHHAPALPVYPRAREVVTSNPVLRSRRMSQLVEESARTLFGKGSRPQTLLRVLHVEQPVAQPSRLPSSTSTREAA
ncbi:MAG: hypothetical protein K9N47_21120 [Prosthecobacter sp.]|uniref:hypothetical protein n=1 Tax=Prosthecobacter sp. TaxID=1965333 RepID=UPI002635EEFB|nr:hypothetical protein [Prosthecobacter sp.]MCF7788638.1 hypothetical protein [Prosthecobacter sp.]